MWMLQAGIVVAVVVGSIWCTPQNDVDSSQHCEVHITDLLQKIENILIRNITKIARDIETLSVHTYNNKDAAAYHFRVLSEKVKTVESEINNTLTKMTAIENRLQIIDQIPEKQDLADLRRFVQTSLDQKTSNLPTTTKVEELLATHVDNLKQTVKEVHQTCESEAGLENVLQEMRKVKEDVGKIANETQATKVTAEECQEQDTQEFGDVKSKVDALQNEVQELRTSLEGKLSVVREGVEEVFNNTQPQRLSATPTLAPGGESPCEDSTFRGANSINVCQSAVRFKRCKVPIVSFHCCRTCTDEGQLEEIGPWRYENRGRSVSTLFVIRHFGP